MHLYSSLTLLYRLLMVGNLKISTSLMSLITLDYITSNIKLFVVTTNHKLYLCLPKMLLYCSSGYPLEDRASLCWWILSRIVNVSTSSRAVKFWKLLSVRFVILLRNPWRAMQPTPLLENVIAFSKDVITFCNML